MLRPTDLLVSVLVITAVVWLNVPKLLVPGLVLTILLLTGYRWWRERKQPLAAERYRWRLVASCVVVAAISVPLILKIVPPNGVYGFRTNLTRSSPDIWYSANAFMGWSLLMAAIMSAGTVTALPATAKRWVLLATFLAPLLCAVVASFMYLERLA
jgi:hypothetical protein